MVLYARITFHNSPCFRTTNSATARRTTTTADDVDRSGYATTEAASSDNDDDDVSGPANEDSGEPAAATTTGRRTASDAFRRGIEEQHVATESTPAAIASGRAAAERAGPDMPPGVRRENYAGESGDDAKVDADDAGRRSDVANCHRAGDRYAAHRVGGGAVWRCDELAAASSDGRSKGTLEADGVADDRRSDTDVRGNAGQYAGRATDHIQVSACDGGGSSACDVICQAGGNTRLCVDSAGHKSNALREVHGHSAGCPTRYESLIARPRLSDKSNGFHSLVKMSTFV